MGTLACVIGLVLINLAVIGFAVWMCYDLKRFVRELERNRH